VNERARVTHELESAKRRTSKGTKRKRSSEVHSLPGERKGRVRAGHQKKERDTHRLERAEQGS